MSDLTFWRVGVVLLLLASAGCTTGTTRSITPESREEAAQYNLQLGISYLRQGNLKVAQEKLEKAIADDSQLAMAYSALGLVFERLGDQAGAEKNYRRAVTLAPENPDALNALAVFLCLQKQNTSEAMRHFQRALAVPQSRAVTNQAMLYTNAGICAKRVDLARAEDYLRAALAVDPAYRDALLQLSEVALARNNPLQARAFLERYLAANAATADALWLGVRIERMLGEAKAAATYADQIKAQFPVSPEMRLLIESERHDRERAP